MPQTDPLIIVPITKKRVGQLANSMFLSLPSSPLIESKKEEKYKLCKVDDITGSYLPPSPNCDGHESYHDLEENALDYFSFAKIDYLIAPTTEKESILKNRHTFAFSRLNCPSPVKNYFNPPNNNNDNININNNNNNNSNYNINDNNNNDDNNSFNNKHKILESEELVLQLEDNHLPSVPPMSPSSSLSEESDIDDISHQILDTDTDTNTNSKSSPELKAQYSKDDLSEFINYNKYNSIRKKKVSKKIENQSRHSIIKNFF